MKYFNMHIRTAIKYKQIIQVAQLSQKDRDAGWVSFGQKWKTEKRIQYSADILGLSSATVMNWPAKLSNAVKKQNKGYYAVQGHSRSSRTV